MNSLINAICTFIDKSKTQDGGYAIAVSTKAWALVEMRGIVTDTRADVATCGCAQVLRSDIHGQYAPHGTP